MYIESYIDMFHDGQTCIPRHANQPSTMTPSCSDLVRKSTMKACRDLLIYQCRSKDTEDINAAPRSSALLVSKQSLEHVGTLVPFLEISIDLMFFWILEMISGGSSYGFP